MTQTFYRCAYKFPSWKPGHCKHHDGFARTHWFESQESAESMKMATERDGGKAFIEQQTISSLLHRADIVKVPKRPPPRSKVMPGGFV